MATKTKSLDPVYSSATPSIPVCHNFNSTELYSVLFGALSLQSSDPVSSVQCFQFFSFSGRALSDDGR